MAMLPLVISFQDEREQLYLLDFLLGQNHHDLPFFITCD
jgi:hypothetical protein